MDKRIDIESIDDNPITFWYEHRFAYSTLSQLVQSIYSAPTTTANVERQFNASRITISSRLTRSNSEQINNAIFLRSARKKLSDCNCFSLLNVHVFLFRNYIYALKLCLFI